MEAVHACEELMQRAEEHSAKEVLGPWDSGRHGTERSRKIKKPNSAANGHVTYID